MFYIFVLFLVTLTSDLCSPVMLIFASLPFPRMLTATMVKKWTPTSTSLKTYVVSLVVLIMTLPVMLCMISYSITAGLED